jgi:hypothetical protein
MTGIPHIHGDFSMMSTDAMQQHGGEYLNREQRKLSYVSSALSLACLTLSVCINFVEYWDCYTAVTGY